MQPPWPRPHRVVLWICFDKGWSDATCLAIAAIDTVNGVCYVYDEYYDCIICPNNQVLKYSTTNREGYREYKSDPRVCCNCKMREQCTQSKKMTKVVTRHIWEPYLEIAEDLRHTQRGQNLYKMRSQTIERVFADAKEKHGMRYTQYRGLRKVQHHLTLIFACMNLKKLALWKRKNSPFPPVLSQIAGQITQIKLCFCPKRYWFSSVPA